MTLVLLSALGLLSAGCTAHAHPQHHHVKRPAGPTIQVTLGWTWVDARWHHGRHIKGYWRHPHYGKSYREFAHGPPVARPHQNAVWVPGHWKGRGHRRHWVRGHWKVRN